MARGDPLLAQEIDSATRMKREQFVICYACVFIILDVFLANRLIWR